MSQSYGKGSNIDDWYKFWIGLGVFFVVAFTYVNYIHFDEISIIGTTVIGLIWFYNFRRIKKARDNTTNEL